jgi:hypothetical protein
MIEVYVNYALLAFLIFLSLYNVNLVLQQLALQTISKEQALIRGSEVIERLVEFDRDIEFIKDQLGVSLNVTRNN